MNGQDEMPPMRPVRSGDVIPETRWWESPERALVSLAILAILWVVIFLAIHVWHVSFAALITVGAVITVVAVAVDVVRWLRKRRP
jgi:uncharacterized membrane protein